MNQEQETKLDQILKTDIHNEKMAIGHMLQDEQAAISASKILHEKYFFTSYGVHILKIVKSCIEKGDSVNDINVKVRSIADEDWKEIAPECNVTKQDYLHDCCVYALPMVGLIAAAEASFKKVQEQYLRRTMLAQYQEAIGRILNTSNVHDLQSVVHEVATKSNDSIDGMITRKEETYVEQALEALNQKEQSFISTGFGQLDEVIEGFRPGQLITIGAGTGVGKSAFAINLALNIANQGHKVGLWSFEMDKQEIFERIFSIKTGLSKKEKPMQEERYNAVKKYLDKTTDDIRMFTDPIKDLSNFYLQCRKLSLRENMKVVIIDYLQLIHLSSDSNGNRVAEIEFLTTNLKNIAGELGITIVILSQLSRAYQKRDNKTPMLSDLRDSGSIEQDSSVVIFLHRPEMQPSHYSVFEQCIKVIIAKNRSGLSGSFFLKYLRNTTKFIKGDNENEK